MPSAPAPPIQWDFGRVVIMEQNILDFFVKEMRFLSDFLQFSKPIQQNNRYHSAIYILNPENTYALQLEIDWMEYETFMYLVYLKNGNLPNKGIIYSYPDGHWCRKFLEEIYKTKCSYKNSLVIYISYCPIFTYYNK